MKQDLTRGLQWSSGNGLSSRLRRLTEPSSLLLVLSLVTLSLLWCHRTRGLMLTVRQVFIQGGTFGLQYCQLLVPLPPHLSHGGPRLSPYHREEAEAAAQRREGPRPRPNSWGSRLGMRPQDFWTPRPGPSPLHLPCQK